jgi:hypothetical protein
MLPCSPNASLKKQAPKKERGEMMNQRLAAIRYNLFRRKADQHLYCAVPEDRPVPKFVDGAEWEYGGRVADDDAPPPGFRDEAAAAARVNGYYIFQAVSA